MKNSKKGIIITLLSILIIIAILIGIMIYIYLCTDYLKTNKQLFFKYTSQLVENEDGFIEQEIIDFFNKRTNSNYENQANLSFDIQVPDLEEEMQLVNKFSIDYDEKTDNINSKKEEQITLNYSEDVKLPFIYRECNNEVGFQTDTVSKNFVVLEDKEELVNMYAYLATLDVNINDILENQDIKNIDFNAINNFISKYLMGTLQNLDENKFTKVENNGMTGYKLTLSAEEFKNVMLSILESVKELDKEKAEKLITRYEEDYDNEYNVEFILYQKNSKLTRLEVIVNNSNVFLEKQENNDEVTYNIECITYEESVKLACNASFKGLGTNNITENYKLCTEISGSIDGGLITGLEESAVSLQKEEEKVYINLLISDAKKTQMIQEKEDVSLTLYESIKSTMDNSEDDTYLKMELEELENDQFKITFRDTKNEYIINNEGEFAQENIKEDKEDNTQENEEFIKFNYIYSNNLQFVDNVQIDDFTDENSVNLTQKDEEYVKNLKKAIEERIEQVNEKQMQELGVEPDQNPILYLSLNSIARNQMISGLQESMVEEFNQKFELYENTNTRGSTVKGLLTTILNSNESSSSDMQITEINFDGEEYEVTEQNITLLKSNIDIADTYRVEFEKDSDTGLIYRAVINKR